ncbi:MAG: DNA starvation/stationary phase protection protein [Chloroflexi bacterium]|nr:DNA starvation/stationary phase protection protein [Chloroflexota bacterium]
MTQVLEPSIARTVPPPTAIPPAVALQGTLVELIELALQGKQAHWNVEGPFFKPVHEQLDAFVGQYRDWYDEVAERLTAIGEAADGRTETVAATADLDRLPAGPLADRDVVEAFDERVALVARRVADRAAAIEGDLASQDLLIGIIQGLDKQRWMLRAQRS